MKDKRFIKYQLKCWLPIFGLSLALMAILFWIEVGTMSITLVTNQYYASYGSSALLTAIIPAMVLTVVYPLSVFDYRYKKNRADTFLQLPLQEKELKRTRLTLSLGMLLTAFTIMYWVGVLLVAIRLMTFNQAGATLSPYNFLGYLLAYGLAIVFLAAEFYTNAFLANLGNTVNDSYIYMVMGQVILLLAVYSIHIYVASLVYYSQGDVYYYVGSIKTSTFSIGSPIYFIYQICNGFTVGSSAVPTFANLQVHEWFSFLVPLALGIGAAVALYLLPDPSGEYYGKSGPRNIPISIIPHVFFFLCGMLLYRTSSFPVFAMLYLIFVLGYYMILAFLYRSFKISKREIITMASVSVVILALNIIPYAVAGAVQIY